MTLPKSAFSSEEFNHFDTMSTTRNDNHLLRPSLNVGTALLPASQPLQRISTSETHTTPGTAVPPVPVLNTASASATVFSSLELAVEPVMPGIYLTKNFIAWNEDNLRAHGFTHIIIIDKHIQELYYPSPLFKLSSQTQSSNGAVDDPFDHYYPQPNSSSLSFGKEFEAIDLNFGEKSYLTTVLPNCYRAVKFINKAMQSGGTILVIDCNGGEQKCVTIVVAYLMYKLNINFSTAFARLKGYYKKADLDRFYISQLYEYEPILQVQRAQSRGHSCSRELHAAILKRKKDHEDDSTITSATTATAFFDTLNPLSQFNTTHTTQEQKELDREQQQQHTQQGQQQQHQQRITVTKSHNHRVQQHTQPQQQQQLANAAFISISGDNYNASAWDDYAME